ncbi:MAG: PKD domain-containing protein [Thermoplasmatota archaeon]
MRTLALLATLTIVAMAFAGCTGDGNGDGDSSSSSSSTSRSSSTSTSTSRSATSTTGSSTTTSTGPSNRAPSGSISVAVNGTNATFALTGSDPDGDTIVWDLTFGDGNSTNGTALPTNVTHVYSASGNFTANFTVTDGKSPVTYDLVVPVAGGGSAGIVFAQKQAFPSNPASSQVIPTPLGNVFAGAAACAGFYADENGQDCVWFALDAAFEGRAFTITASAGDPDYEFWPACDPTDAMNPAFAGSTAAGPEAGTIPAGTGCVVIWTKSPPDAPTHTFTVL